MNTALQKTACSRHTQVHTHVTEQVSNTSWDKDSTESVGEAKKQLQDMQAIKYKLEKRKRKKKKREKRKTGENIRAEHIRSVSHKVRT